MHVIHIRSYNLPRLPKSHSGKVLIPITIRTKNQVKLSGCCYRSNSFTAIDSECVELGAQQFVFEPRRVLIIMFCDLVDIEKRGNGLHVIHTNLCRDPPLKPFC
jgi:hypothetical protein